MEIMVTMDELIDMLKAAERAVFRLETLDRYAAPGEVELFRAFRAGAPMPKRGPRNDPWLRMVADSVASGCTWARVHVVSRPLSEYLQFELLGYHGNVDAGEHVRIADRAACPPQLAALRLDFWLLDEDVGVVVHYDTDGRRVGMESAADVSALLSYHDLAVAHSVPLNQFVASVQDELPRAW